MKSNGESKKADVSIPQAQLIKEIERLRKRVASLERASKKRAAPSTDAKRLGTALTEALEQQTATAEILRVISSSPTDVQPVFETILDNATRLCEARRGSLFLFDGEAYHAVAFRGAAPALVEHHMRAPIRPGPHTALARVIHELRPVQIDDVLADAAFHEGDPLRRAVVELEGMRTLLMVPLLKEGRLVGSIGIHRGQVRPFTARQISLMQTFADQAVIAIENVRLFKELEARNRDLTEALDRQTATADILRVISSSPTDLQAVMAAIVENAARLADAEHAMIGRAEGDVIRWLAAYGTTPLVSTGQPITRSLPTGRAILDRQTTQIEDVAKIAYEFETVGRAYREQGVRTILATPLLREGTGVGVLLVRRTAVRPFTDKQIALLQTFADQAVIAIENVRLFKELQTRTADLTRSVDQLTALGEVGRAVSSTLDLDTVLSTIVARAVQLSGTDGGVIYEYDEAGQTFRFTAAHRMDEELVEVLRVAPIRLGEGATGQSAANRTPVQVPDILEGEQYGAARIRSILVRLGYRSVLAVPLLLEQRIVGALTVWRQETGPFAPEVVNLLQSFATQSALAIQNARLFREIAEKGRQLEAASQHKSEFLANMSHELRTPLNAIIGFSEVLLERMFGEVNDKQAEYLQDILSSGRHLLSLINDILDLSKIEAGRMELALAPFHVPVAIENAITLVKERAARHGIALHMEVDARLGEVDGDERKFKQVLLNLLSNAVKFTPEGGRIGVKACLTDGVIEISVSDTGIGIAPEDQGTIFEEFRQVGSDDERRHEGTGLGLTLTKKFVEMHGGRIWVASEMGRGSTFTFTLPLRAG